MSVCVAGYLTEVGAGLAGKFLTGDSVPYRILGISAYYHDSAAALLEDGNIVAAAQEERFSRLKHDAGFPAGAIQYCLSEADIDLADLDAVIFYFRRTGLQRLRSQP